MAVGLRRLLRCARRRQPLTSTISPSTRPILVVLPALLVLLQLQLHLLLVIPVATATDATPATEKPFGMPRPRSYSHEQSQYYDRQTTFEERLSRQINPIAAAINPTIRGGVWRLGQIEQSYLRMRPSIRRFLFGFLLNVFGAFF